MKVKDKFSETGIFQLMPDDLKIFYLLDPKEIDMIYLDSYGLRSLSALGVREEPQAIADALYKANKWKWNILYDIMITEIPLDNNYSLEEHENEEEVNKHNDTRMDGRTGQVNAFNDESFVNDTHDSEREDTTGDYETKKKRQLTRNIMNTFKTDNLDRVLNFLRHDFLHENMFADLNLYMTLPKYEI